MTDFIANLVAAITLDGEEPEIALSKTKAEHWAGRDERLMAPFEDDQIKNLLDTAVPASG